MCKLVLSLLSSDQRDNCLILDTSPDLHMTEICCVDRQEVRKQFFMFCCPFSEDVQDVLSVKCPPFMQIYFGWMILEILFAFLWRMILRFATGEDLMGQHVSDSRTCSTGGCDIT